jgi:hypothetical protein
MAAGTFFHNRQEWIYAPDMVFVVLALLSQRGFGAALHCTGLMPGWVGSATIHQRPGWLLLLPLFRLQAGMDFIISTIVLLLRTKVTEIASSR